MGSHNVSCAVSGLSIGWQDKASYILLHPQNYMLLRATDAKFSVPTKDPNFYSTGYYIYSDRLFKPFGIPILGEYDTYGALEYIETNIFTEQLEEMFGISIEDIVKISSLSCEYGISRRQESFDRAKTLPGKQKQRFSILSELSGMFIHGDIYTYLAKYNQDHKKGWRGSHTLSELYDRLVKAINEYDSDEPKDLDGRAERALRSIFDDPLEGRPPKDEDGYHLGNFLDYKWYTFKALFRPYFKKGLLKKEICNFLQFDINLNECNRLYFPGMYSSECSDNIIQKELYKAALGVVGRRVAFLAEENVTEDAKCRFCEIIKTKYLDDACKECHLEYCGW